MCNLEENNEVSLTHLTCGKRFCGLGQRLGFSDEPIGIRYLLAKLEATSCSEHTKIRINKTHAHTLTHV
jgi:hypothetical protein